MMPVLRRLPAMLAALLGRPLTLDVFRSLAVRVLGMLAALLLYLVLARQLPVAEFGVYALAFGWLNLLAMVATLGTDNAALRFLPEYRVAGKLDLAAGFQRFAARLSIAVAVPLMLGAAAIAAVAVSAGQLAPATMQVVAILLLALPFIALIAQRQALLRVAGRVVAAVVPEQVLRPLATAAIALGIVALLGALDARAAAVALVLATLAGFVAGSMLLARTDIPWRGVAPREDRRAWLATSLRLGLFSWLYLLLRQLDLLLVGALLDAERAAQYAIATRCADIALFVALAVDVLIAPLVAQRHAEGDRTRLAALMRRSVQLSAALTLPTALLLALASPWLLGLFGAHYVEGRVAFMVLVAGHALAVCGGYGSYLLTMTGREREALVVLLLALAVHVTLCLLLIPRLELVGAALACAGGSLAWRLGSAWVAWRALGVNPLLVGPQVRA